MIPQKTEPGGLSMSHLIETLNGLADGWSALAVALFIQSSLVIAVLLTVEWALRRHVRAAIRYGLLLLVLAKLVMPPGLASPTAAAYWLRAPSDMGVPEPQRRAVTATVQEVEATVDNTSSQVGLDTVATRSTLTLPAVLMGAWGWIALALFGVLGRRSLEIRRIIVSSATPSRELEQLLAQCRERMTGGRNIQVRISDRITSPALCGLWRPTILIPRKLVERLVEPDLQAILVHELRHVERHDLWINHLQTVLQILYWWHPLLWLANARIRQVREEAVDDAVMVALADRAERYPATLVEVAKAVMKRPFPRLGFLGIFESRSRLSRRVRRLIEEPVPRRATLGWPAVAGLVLAGAVLLPMARAERSAGSPPGGPATPSPSTEAVVFLDCILFEVSAEPFRSRYPEPYQVGQHGEQVWITYGPESPYRIFMDFMPGTQARMVSQPRLALHSGVAGTISMTRAEDIRGQTIQLGTECRLTVVLQGAELDLTIQATLTELDSSHPAGYAEHEVANARVRVRLDESSAVAMAAVGHQKRFVLLVRPSVVSESELEHLLAGSNVPSPGATPSPVSTEPTSGAAADIPQVVLEARLAEVPESFAVSLQQDKSMLSSAGSGSARSLSPAESSQLLHALMEQNGVDVLTMPRITTLSGRQCQLQVVETHSFAPDVRDETGKPGVALALPPRSLSPDGHPTQPVTLGLTVDILPRVNEGASEVDLVVLASAKDLIRPAGSGKAGHEAPVVARIEEAREGAPLPLPVIRTRTLTSRATIPNGHTLLLIEAAPNVMVREEAAPPRGVGAGQPGSARRLLLLLTPTVVGPDGVSLGAPR
jgi:beta-lactamase regulating signal transducer with metallopeptidase domain